MHSIAGDGATRIELCLLYGHQIEEANFSYGSAPAWPPLVATVGYAVHSGRTPIEVAPCAWSPAPRTQSGQKRSFMCDCFGAGYSSCEIPLESMPF